MKEQHKNRLTTLAMGMAAGYYTEMVFGYGEQRPTRNTLSKGEKKKFKSCNYYPCGKSRKPMQTACESYRKKKK